MHSIQDNEEQLKVAQVFKVIWHDSDPEIIKLILKKNVNIKWILPSRWLFDVSRLNFDCTLLHVAYVREKIAYFKILLDHGADFTIKNQNGSTILHYIVEDLQQNQKPNDYSWLLNNPYVTAILTAHVKFANSHNPCDKNGLSHFHVACMTNHIEAAKLFLSNGVLIDESVSIDYPMKPGYDSLHFAAEFDNFETGELLISRGANMHLKNSNGMNPLHLLINRRLEMFDAGRSAGKGELTDTISKKIELNGRLLNLFLENDTLSCDVTDDLGLSNFHVACLLQDSSLVESLLDQVSKINHKVNSDSPICPGYTGLHFAAHCNFDTVMLLIKKGANLTAKDVKGVTALDVCMRWLKVQEIHSLVASVPKLRKIHFSDGKTKLVDCILAMESQSSLNNFLQGCINANTHLPNDSPIWPGCTALHLAVAFSKNFVTKDEAVKQLDVCFHHDANIYAQDKYGSTPLHLAFRQNKQQVMDYFFNFVGLVLNKIENMTDDDGLSYLHISSAFDSKSNFTRKLLPARHGKQSAVNATYNGKSLDAIKTGWTPLQVALDSKNYGAVSVILERCDKLIKIDCEGFTVYHRLLSIEKGEYRYCAHNLLNTMQRKERVVESIGLTLLHVVSWYDNAQAVRELLEVGSDVEAVIGESVDDKNLVQFAGCRPLHLAMMNESKQAVRELLEWGADIFAKRLDSTSSSLSQALTGKNDKILDLFILLLWNDKELQKSMEKQLGLTMLHIACHTMDVKKVKILLKKGVDVNARTLDDSNIWPGCTSVHVLLMKANEINRKDKRLSILLSIMELLLKNEIDLTVRDARERTPLFLILERDQNWDNKDLFPKCLLVKLVLKHYHQFNVNPVVNEGLSYFHLACLTNNLDAVEKFLKLGNINVNQQMGLFSIVYAGCTPLHFALTYPYVSCNEHENDDDDDDDHDDHDDDANVRIVELLLKHGASIIIENSIGNTPLHLLLDRYERRLYLTEKLLEYSAKADLNIRCIEGRTPMEIQLRSSTEVEEIQLLVNYGVHINSCNPITNEGYIALAYADESREDDERAEIFQMIIDSPGLSELDELGRNAIHNIVTTCNYTDDYDEDEDAFIISEDCYRSLITSLIKLGCNVDHQDNSGKTALHQAIIFRNDNAVLALLALGADFNIVDTSGKTAFSYVFEPRMGKLNDDAVVVYRKERLSATFISYVKKLKLLRIEVSNDNVRLQTRMIQNRKELVDSVDQDIFIEKVDATENIKIGRGDLTLRNFLCETGAISAFPSITPQERKEVANFFENINVEEFHEIKFFIKLQYRKAVKRLSLIDPARDSLQNLLCYPLPYLCLDNVMKYLSNSELRNVIAASIDEDHL